MDFSHPLAVITPTLDADVLWVLTQADTDFTPGQVHRVLNDRSVDGIRKVLERLTTQGIVTRRTVGPSNTYQFNEHHLAAEPIRALVNQRTTLLRRLRDHTATWADPPLYGAVFGSAATAAHHPSSDLDLILVHADTSDTALWDQNTNNLAALATAWTGNDTRILTFSESDITRLAGTEPVLDDIAATGLAFAGDYDWFARAHSTTHRRKVRASHVKGTR